MANVHVRDATADDFGGSSNNGKGSSIPDGIVTVLGTVERPVLDVSVQLPDGSTTVVRAGTVLHRTLIGHALRIAETGVPIRFQIDTTQGKRGSYQTAGPVKR